jgi:trehalose synthase
VWDDLEDEKIEIIPPSIDAFSPKNQDLPDDDVRAILVRAGIAAGDADGSATYTRTDGSTASVERRANLSGSPLLDLDSPVLTQVSRWDRLKDPLGVMEGFVKHSEHPDLHLLLAGPETEGVADDPEGAEVLDEVKEAREALPEDMRSRIHLVSLPMEDGEENAVMVNALQRHATVVTQKSIAEGFGLTVAEAMWKGRPVVATRIGGIQDQIVHGETGLLIDDPHDLAAFGRAVDELASDPQRAEEMGHAAYERVREEFLGPRHLMQYLDLVVRLTG